MQKSPTKLLKLVNERGLIRSRDLVAYSIPRISLTRAVRQGHLEKISRGIYALPGRRFSEHESLANIATRVPSGVICLLSALRFHNLTTQAPHAVWLAIQNKSIAPKVDYPPIRVVRFSGAAFSEGVEERNIDKVMVKVTSVEKTVVDCFKFRNKIGLDVALEALRSAWESNELNQEEIWRLAKICHVSNFIRPYLESLA